MPFDLLKKDRPEDLTEILLAYTINTMVGLLYKLNFFLTSEL